ncbi:M15 family metallopeptidase [Bulleidia sp. zg-1006]|uniref:M15 family metallopeptidase n=1 Tax=Bulleidia sp. zg-1006 TaxID=2806552 RepID=UPI001939C8CB|nr:M15 family metallopeptidase [Bulleidia sp. zg-1006]QRG86738.1 M15 family metallopeptidase [Bulleidia sp. zg-1006]
MSKKRMNLNVIAKSVIVVGIVILSVSIFLLNHPQLTKPFIKPEQKNTTTNTQKKTLPQALTEANSITVLVDKTHGLPKDYVPSDLSSPYLNSTADVIQLRKEAANQAKAMFEASKKDKVPMFITAGYRNYDQQKDYYENRVNLLGEEEANKTTASAGFSENQTGLALDITDKADGHNTVKFAETSTYKWLVENAHKYGFILRYPNHKEKITGYTYMPWHWRYVGSDVAKKMVKEGGVDLTFEEYFHTQK